MKMSRDLSVIWSILAGLALATAAGAILAGCHLGDAIQDAQSNGSVERVLTALPTAIAGDPISWGVIGTTVAGFIATAIGGHRVVTGRWIFQKPIPAVIADVAQTLSKDIAPPTQESK